MATGSRAFMFMGSPTLAGHYVQDVHASVPTALSKSFSDLRTDSRLVFSSFLALVAWLYHICKLHMFFPYSHPNPAIQDSA